MTRGRTRVMFSMGRSHWAGDSRIASQVIGRTSMDLCLEDSHLKFRKIHLVYLKILIARRDYSTTSRVKKVSSIKPSKYSHAGRQAMNIFAQNRSSTTAAIHESPTHQTPNIFHEQKDQKPCVAEFQFLNSSHHLAIPPV